MPDDLSIIACDDGPDGQEAPIPITTVSYSLEQLGRRAFEIIEQTDPGFEPDVTRMCAPILLPTHLTVRQSCGAASPQREDASPSKKGCVTMPV